MTDEIDWDALVEDLARVEHRQWWEWSSTLAKEEVLSDTRVDRWREYWKRYDQLDDDAKEHDRKWAKKAAEVVHDHMENGDG